MSQFYTNEGLLKRIDNIYRLSVLASKRAQELMFGAKKIVEIKSNKSTIVSVQEIYEGKVNYREGVPQPDLAELLQSQVSGNENKA